LARAEKLIARLRARPKDLSWDELVRALEALGFGQAKPGRTGGSRRRFVHPTGPVITLHQPHPARVVKRYVIEDVLKALEEAGLI
jgi:predicted RNA binding protein YcfA (HicA-like mRNA interferase family)